ncbi:Rhodanese-like domain-containing protein [Rhynchospora pubera]|uniref:Rhodanese-like domain-containing protein n=1 Tax=Rhynchospora pubera TaxID=906938 RepID=A0AAV8D056_9POAL|nr:Rhodanese-like domain-containing protein [Rhynchospora pubera]
MATSVSPEELVITVDVNTAKDLVSSGHLYLDVRTHEEFDKGHLENSIVVPYLFITPQGREKNPQFLEQVLSVCKMEDNIIVGCRSGVRSLEASAELLNAGFKSIKNMGGGYIAWVANGFSVKQPQESV